MQGVDAYENTSDDLMLEQFVIEHKPLVRKIALHIKRRLPSHIDFEDLLQSGFIGLLEAKKNYKEGLGTTFETFASKRIRGSIIDSLRKNSWGTRETIKNMRMIGDAIARVEQRLQKQPTSEEIANELGISADEHMEMCKQINLSNVISLDNMDVDYLLDGAAEENPQEITQQKELIVSIKSMLETLPEKEKLVLSLYYNDEFTFKQIGEILDLTEARICQLHSQAITRIQTRLVKNDEKHKYLVKGEYS